MKFTLFWRDGKREIVEGRDVADAMNKRGYGHGALGALDFYSNGDDESYAWDMDARKWGFAPIKTAREKKA